MRVQPTLQLSKIVNLNEFRAVFVEHRARKPHRCGLFATLDVECRRTCRVHRDEYIRNDTASAINGTSSDGVVDIIPIDLDAVSVSQFAVGIPLIDVVGIVVSVWFLDTAPGRGVEPRHGKPQPAAVREVNRFLNQSFPERAASDDLAPVIVLHGSGKDFARRGRPLVNENRKLNVLESSLPVGVQIGTRAVQSLHVDDLVALFKEFVAEHIGLVQIASGVFPEVEYQVIHPLGAKFGDSGNELDICSPRKLREFDIARLRVNHECRVNAMNRNFASRDIKRNLFPVAIDDNFHL